MKSQGGAWNARDVAVRDRRQEREARRERHKDVPGDWGLGLRFGAWSFRFGVLGARFGVWGLRFGFRIQGSGIKLEASSVRTIEKKRVGDMYPSPGRTLLVVKETCDGISG